MFIGHFAVGFAAKSLAPRTSLGTLFAASQLLDLVWPILVLLGVEKVRVDPGNTAFTPLDFVNYPWSHSLLMALVWAAGFALVYRARTGFARGAWVVGALVLSHWALDFVSHRPDLPLAPGASRVGLGLWNSVPATVIAETALFAVGVTSALLLGFFLLSAGPIGFQYAAGITFPVPEGTSNGLLLMAGQISGILFIFAMNAMKSPANGSMAGPLVGLAISLVLCLGLVALLKEPAGMLTQTGLTSGARTTAKPA